MTDTREHPDYLAPFESFHAFAMRGGGMLYRGRLRSEYDTDLSAAERHFRAVPNTHFHMERIDGGVYATLRVQSRHRRMSYWRNILLFVLTIITTIGAGAEMLRGSPGPLALAPFEFIVNLATHALVGQWDHAMNVVLPEFARMMITGIPYAAALIFVLLAHEMGHFIAARRHGIDSTLPFFIPAPFFFGTLGAIIRMRSPMIHRRALFDVGIAGPLAGLVASSIVCVIGLGMSVYVPEAQSHSSVQFGSSPLFSIFARLILGTAPPSYAVHLHPVAVAGWFGFFVTFLNLMPLGQLDGGHICYAFTGRRQRYFSWGTFVAIAVTGYFHHAWIAFAVLALLLMRAKHPPVMDDRVRLGWVRCCLGLFILVVFVLLVVPDPIELVEYGS